MSVMPDLAMTVQLLLGNEQHYRLMNALYQTLTFTLTYEHAYADTY